MKYNISFILPKLYSCRFKSAEAFCTSTLNSLLRECKAIHRHRFGGMELVGEELYCTRFTASSLYSDQVVEVKPRSLIWMDLLIAVQKAF